MLWKRSGVAHEPESAMCHLREDGGELLSYLVTLAAPNERNSTNRPGREGKSGFPAMLGKISSYPKCYCQHKTTTPKLADIPFVRCELMELDQDSGLPLSDTVFWAARSTCFLSFISCYFQKEAQKKAVSPLSNHLGFFHLKIGTSRGSSWPRDRTQVSCTAGRFFTSWATREGQLSKFVITRFSTCIRARTHQTLIFVPSVLQWSQIALASLLTTQRHLSGLLGLLSMTSQHRWPRTPPWNCLPVASTGAFPRWSCSPDCSFGAPGPGLSVPYLLVLPGLGPASSLLPFFPSDRFHSVLHPQVFIPLWTHNLKFKWNSYGISLLLFSTELPNNRKANDIARGYFMVRNRSATKNKN